MNSVPSADFSIQVRWLLARSLVALAVIASTATTPRLLTGTGLVACVWLDAVSGWHARKTGAFKTGFASACEPMVDLLCFVWAPAAWVMACETALTTRVAVGAYALAGLFRLARFQIEGLVRGGYRGLPVTYNGYAVPLLGSLVATVLPWPALVWPVGLLVLAGAMVSTRFVVPEL